MGLLDTLANNQQVRQELQSFVGRYEQGHPSEGYSDEEVVNRYQQVAPQLSQGEYLRAAEQSFARLSPQEREQFGQFVSQQAQQQGINLPGAGQGGYQNPQQLAQMAGQLHEQSPGLLNQLVSSLSGSGGGAGGMLSNPAAKAALAGIAALAVKHVMQQRGFY